MVVGSLFTGSVELKRISGVTSEYTENELGSFRQDVEKRIYSKYGRPLAKTTFSMNSNEYIYSVHEFKNQIYAVERMEIDGAEINTGSYAVDLETGSIEMGSGEVDTYGGYRVEVEWVPQIFSDLALYKTALFVSERLVLITGASTQGTHVGLLSKRVKEIEDELRPKGCVMSSKYENWDFRQGRHLVQDFPSQNIF